MCMPRMPRIPRPAPMIIASPDNREAIFQGDLQTRMRRARAGAAANILTGPTGIPSTPTLGGVAA